MINKAYRRWYRCIRDDANNKAIGFEIEVKIEIKV